MALAESIVESVEDGKLRPGHRLPARRELAYQLGVSVNTVSNAYIELERRGYIYARVGSGSFIQSPKADSEVNYWSLGGRPLGLVDLSMCRACNVPESDRLLESALTALGNSPQGFPASASRPIVGLDRHRAAGSAWLGQIGWPVPAQRIIVTNGNSNSLLIVLSSLTKAGDIVVTEGISNNIVTALSSMLHFQLRGLPIDSDGIIPEAFDQACRSEAVKALVTTPNLNNPTCSVVPETRRQQLAEIARRYSVAVVENDPYGPLLEDRPPPLTTFIAENGYYMTTLSKPAAAWLRTGYLVVPDHNMPRVTARLRTTCWMATTMVAEIAARAIENGSLNQLVESQRRELRARQKIVSKVLEGFNVKNAPTGLMAWLELPKPWRASRFVSQARQHNIALTPAEPFMVGQMPEPQAVRICISVVDSKKTLEKALLFLRELLQDGAEPGEDLVRSGD